MAGVLPRSLTVRRGHFSTQHEKEMTICGNYSGLAAVMRAGCLVLCTILKRG
jgi:hypothetical protein